MGGISTQENLNVGAVAKVISATDATSKTTGALIVTGGLGVSKNIHGKNVFVEDVVSNSVVILDTTTSSSATTGALKVVGGISTQENLNVGAVAKIISGTDATSKTTGALIVTGGLGVAKNIHGKNVFVEDVVSNSVVILDTTTSTSATTGALKVAGGISTQENLHIGGVAKVHDTTTSSSKTTGSLIVAGGAGVSGPLFGAAATLDGVVTLTDATEATSSTTGALKAAGGVGIAKDVYVGERAYVTGGLITNTGQVTKKTYSFTGALTSGQTIADSTITITFSAHVFYAKIVAHLIESDAEVSTLSMECGGGHRTGGTPLTIAKGSTSVFGSTSTNPWNSVPAVTTTTVALAPTTNMAAVGNYNIFIEYISAHASGAVTNIIEGSTTQITFGY